MNTKANHMTEYPYTKHNLLDEPQTYQFSAYEGIGFLHAYLGVRIAAAEKFKTRYVKILSEKKLLSSESYHIHTAFKNEFDSAANSAFSQAKQRYTGDFPTIILMRSGKELQQSLDAWERRHGNINLHRFLPQLLAITIHEDFQSTKDIAYKNLSILIKKFEVTKKLYSEYSIDFKKASDTYTVLSNYALLSLCLMAYYQRDHNLKFLNAALKINDLLISTQDQLLTAEDTLPTFLALKMEIRATHELLQKNVISL
jgi:hypothetical protein